MFFSNKLEASHEFTVGLLVKMRTVRGRAFANREWIFDDLIGIHPILTPNHHLSRSGDKIG